MASVAEPLVLGVAGGSGSGKTTVVDAILGHVGHDRIAVLRHDAYYKDLGHLPLEERREVNLDHPHAFDDELFTAHIDQVVSGAPVDVPTYDYTTYTRGSATTTVLPRPVLLVEGILLFASPSLRERMHVKVFVDAEADLRLLRRLRRDLIERGRSIESVLHQYETTVRPMHLEFVEPSKRWADIIIPEGGHNRVAIEMVASRVEAMLGRG